MVKPRSDLAAQEEILDRAVWRKWNKYIWSGLLILGIGCLLIVVGRCSTLVHIPQKAY